MGKLSLKKCLSRKRGPLIEVYKRYINAISKPVVKSKPLTLITLLYDFDKEVINLYGYVVIYRI